MPTTQQNMGNVQQPDDLETRVSAAYKIHRGIGKLFFGAASFLYHTIIGFTPFMGKQMEKVKAEDEAEPEGQRVFSWYKPRKAYQLGGLARAGLAGYGAAKAGAIATGITGLLAKYLGFSIAAHALAPIIAVPLLLYTGYKALDLFTTTKPFYHINNFAKKFMFGGRNYMWQPGTP